MERWHGEGAARGPACDHGHATQAHVGTPFAPVCLPAACRRDFLKAGTMAKGASESGKVESYICSKLKRNPLASGSCAKYLGYFVAGARAVQPACAAWAKQHRGGSPHAAGAHGARTCARGAEETEGAFLRGSQWLVWKFESDATLGNALDGELGPFPACLENYVLKRDGSTMSSDKRDSLVRAACGVRRRASGVHMSHTGQARSPCAALAQCRRVFHPNVLPPGIAGHQVHPSPDASGAQEAA